MNGGKMSRRVKIIHHYHPKNTDDDTDDYTYPLPADEITAHLWKVYLTLTFTSLVAATGAHCYQYLVTDPALVGGYYELAVILSLVCCLVITFTHHSPTTVPFRLSLLFLMAFADGLALRPLIEEALKTDETILPSAFLGTAVIFVAFTLAALFSRDYAILDLGGPLLSALFLLILFSFASIFIKSEMLVWGILYGGLILFSLFVAYDTQLIVALRQRGDEDFILHSLNLYLDLLLIFKHLLLILIRMKKKNE